MRRARTTTNGTPIDDLWNGSDSPLLPSVIHFSLFLRSKIEKKKWLNQAKCDILCGNMVSTVLFPTIKMFFCIHTFGID